MCTIFCPSSHVIIECAVRGAEMTFSRLLHMLRVKHLLNTLANVDR